MRRKNHMAMFKVPNNFILDDSLNFSTRRVGCALYSRCNTLGACRMSMRQLAELAQCSPATVLNAVRKLESSGYITRDKHLGYSADKKRLVYQKSEFTVLRNSNFTFIPHNVFYFIMKNSSFTVYLFLRLCAGNDKRAFPSLNRISNDLYISKSAVCGALKELSSVGLIHRQPCRRKGKKEFCCNSYFFIRNARPRRKTRSVIFPIRKAGRIHTVKRIPKIHVQQRRCKKLFHISIIRRYSRKFNTGG